MFEKRKPTITTFLDELDIFGKQYTVLYLANVDWSRDGKNANFSLSLVIVILIFKNRYLSLFTL